MIKVIEDTEHCNLNWRFWLTEKLGSREEISGGIQDQIIAIIVGYGMEVDWEDA